MSFNVLNVGLCTKKRNGEDNIFVQRHMKKSGDPIFTPDQHVKQQTMIPLNELTK